MADVDVIETTPGPLVRTLARVLPGVRDTEDQIPAYARRWHEQNQAALSSGEPVWVALGDSLTQGIGASSLETTFVRQVQRRLADAGRPVPVLNLSVSGARIQDVIDRQLPKLSQLAHDPAFVTCTVGSNDLLRSVRLKRTTKQLGALFDALPKGSIVATVPAAGSLVAKYVNRIIEGEAPLREHRIADVASHLSGWRRRIAGDGFHPNDEGYQAWTAAFSEVLIAD